MWGGCEQQGCWNFYDSDSCNADPNCKWDTGDDWGWCEQLGCWSFDDTNETMCETTASTLYGLNCTYDDDSSGYCTGPWTDDCYKYTTSGTCNAPCAWESHEWCYEQAKSCPNMTTEGDCLMSGWCMWDPIQQTCDDPIGGINLVGLNPGCFVFDNNAIECQNVTGCTWNSTSKGCTGLEADGIQCQNVTNKTLCNVITMFSTCCKWESGSCSVDYTMTCWDNAKEPPSGIKKCDDSNVVDSQTCEKIAGYPWYMPCEWNNNTEKCAFKTDDFIGVGGSFKDITTKQGCDFAGGTWKTEYYCDNNNTVDTSDDKLSPITWCEMGFGGLSKTCDDSCFACTSQTTCINSAQGHCEWQTDSMDSTRGWCDVPKQIGTFGGNCDKDCWACELKTDAKKACESSQNKCKWDSINSKCIPKSEKTCSEKCFNCYDKDICVNQGLGSAGSCKWDDQESICKPKNFDGEICFNGKDDDGNEKVDCEDPDCYFDPFCNAVGTGECWNYNLEVDCDSATDCEWVTDPWTSQTWCDRKGATCWQYDENQTACDEASSCNWFDSGHCDINKTKADSCFTYTKKTACEGNTDCIWLADTFSPTGGWCDYKLFECGWNQTLQQSKTNCEADGRCKWSTDTFSQTGWCQPKCFAMDVNGAPLYDTQTKCDAIEECKWWGGWCEPNTTEVGMIGGGGCAMYDGDQTTCLNQPGCLWFQEQSDGECDVNVTSQCGLYSNNETACGDQSECLWLTSYGWSWCENKYYKCGSLYDNNQTGCEADSLCIWFNDSWGSRCEPSCFNSSLTQDECTGLVGCNWTSGGLCDPVAVMYMFGDMEEGPPIELAMDDCGSSSSEDSFTDSSDICFLGMKDMQKSFGFSIGIDNVDGAAFCNGEQTNNGILGSGFTTAKFYWYLDTDGIDTNNCDSDDGAYTGFEFYFKYITKWEDGGLSETKTAYKCDSGSWTITDIKLTPWKKKMCSELRGAMVAVSKEDLNKFSTLYNSTKDMRIYGLTANASGSESSPLDTVGPGYYMAGKADSKFENCMGFDDADNDGLYPWEDPDCKMMIMGVMFEDCYTMFDDDFDGLVNCDDPDCSWDPICGGTGTTVYDENDKTAPSITWTEVNVFPDGAFIIYDTDEPANGTVIFYNDSSTCSYGNSSGTTRIIRDIGIFDDYIREFKTWHDGPVDNFEYNHEKLGYDLATNVTYFYKTKICDASGNCVETACSNFTTSASLSACKACESMVKFDFTPPTGDDPYLGGLQFKFDWDGTGDFATQGGACGTNYGEKANYTKTNASMKIENENSTQTWSITLKDMQVTSDISTDLSDNLYANASSVNSSDVFYVGMNHSTWLDLLSETNVNYIEIILPGNSSRLMHCDDDLSGCTDRTSIAISRYYNSTGDYTVWTVPADSTTMSIYFGDQGATASSSSSSTGTSGSSSATGGVIAVTGLVKVSKTWPIVYASVPKVWDISSSATGIETIEFELNKRISNVKMTVEKLDNKPATITKDLSKEVYQYLEITKGNFYDKDMKPAKIKFKIAKTWTSNNNIDEATVRLNRYNSGEWEELATTRISGDKDYVHFESESKGFSYFAISGESKTTATTVPQATTTTLPSTTTTVSSPIVPGVDNNLIVGATILALVLVIVFWAWMNKKEVKAKEPVKKK